MGILSHAADLLRKPWGGFTLTLEMRNYDIKDERMDYLFIIYNTAKAYLVDEAAREKTIQINYSLTLPFSEDKLQKHIFDKVDKRAKPVKYDNKKIKKILKITDEEYILLGLERLDRKKDEITERLKRTIARKQRDEEIVRLFKNGVSTVEISERTGTHIRTVQRAIRAEKVREKKAATNLIATLFPIPSDSESESAIATPDEHKAARLFRLSYNDKMEAEGCDEQLTTLRVLANTKRNVLILGSAGTGKTTLAKEYLKTLSKKERAKVLIVAPTWKAVSNLNGTTVHRAFELSCSIQQDTPIEKVPKALKNIDTIIIDEISMLRVDVFTRMVQIIKFAEQKNNQPIRIIAIGDFGQLPPVCVSEDKEVLEKIYPGIYCYDSPLWNNLNFQKIVLHQVHRQEDKELSDYLEALKYGSKKVVEWFNNNSYSGFSDNAITICPTNDLVKEYTEIYIQENWHYCFDTYEAEYDGTLTDELPVEKNIQLGLCRIMFLWNGKKYKRGDFAMIESFSDDGIDVTMEKTGERIQVQRETWTLSNGTKYTQYPMCLACAITVHKAQGCTFDEINIDRGNGFWMPGQLYVALSRCKTKNGIHLLRPLKEKDVHADLKALGMMVNETEIEDDE